ncbi:chemotaxis protein CheB [Methylobacterium frigidaeris]|jgi:two-component system, chemotaxis family, protein-glutamate methylesterase/glutaminase|uniref:protein-glutamate methylesterase n=1 Tax=Methylobacterium frigidaeris TaxID=2038277 RepID=A0AA37M7W4_9HYPH|nr:chemotaxis protein CheB [Methylobacterium frigidaeris]GJD66370.1 Protein-glutamate methylesterase/protein-glutamine glutaminase [Methylobacterium frigidaeris]
MASEPSCPWFVAIGASGSRGLQDIQAVLQELPPSLAASVLIVLHRPRDQVSYLADVLRRSSRMPVRLAGDGERLVPGTAYVGGPADHLTLGTGGLIALVADPGHQYRNRTIDLLFRSVAAHGGGRVIGVVLSGSLDDGARGLAAIHAAGGLSMVLAPDRHATAGMPESAIAYDGPVDLVGTLSEIARGICAVAR